MRWRSWFTRKPFWFKFITVAFVGVTFQYVIQVGVLAAGLVWWQQSVVVSDTTSFAVQTLLKVDDQFYYCSSNFVLNDIEHGRGWVPLNIKDGQTYIPAEGTFNPDTLCMFQSIMTLSERINVRMWVDLTTYFDSVE